MSSLYTTKSLGRPWLPSPSRTRYGSKPYNNNPKLRWLSPTEPPRWSKTHERLTLLTALILLGIWWFTFGPQNFTLPTLPYTWKKADNFAYILSPTTPSQLCSSIMQLESLQRFGTTGVGVGRVLLWGGGNGEVEKQLLKIAEQEFGAVVRRPTTQKNSTVGILAAAGGSEFKRVIALDADTVILKPLDELFFASLPEGEGAEGGEKGAVILSPSKSLFKSLQRGADINHISPLPKIFQTKTLRQPIISPPGSSAKLQLMNSNLAHFSDGPPYLPLIGTNRDALIPTCPSGIDQCEALEVWQWLYLDFRARRKEICGEGFNEWEAEEALDGANRRVISLQDRVFKGIGGNSGM
jgi:hypothetical protein